MTESQRLFIDLEPPAGGLQRLQQRLRQAEGRRHTGWWYPLGAGVLVMCLLVLLLLPGLLAERRMTQRLTHAVRVTVAPPPQGIRVINGTAIALPDTTPAVRVYLVQASSNH